MLTDVIHDRGRGPEIQGTRITVYNLLPHFLDPESTEDFICQLHELTHEQVAAARAYVLNNPEVLARHLEIEARMAAGNSPQVIEQAKRTHETFLRFRAWLAARDGTAVTSHTADETVRNGPTGSGSTQLPTFKEWIAEGESRQVEGS